jgi:hypothetical protein
MSCNAIQLSHAIQEIRQAFASEDFALADRLWNRYAGHLRQAILDGTATEATLSQTRELVDWSALVGKAFRAHSAAQLNSMHVAEVYSAAGSQATLEAGARWRHNPATSSATGPLLCLRF